MLRLGSGEAPCLARMQSWSGIGDFGSKKGRSKKGDLGSEGEGKEGKPRRVPLPYQFMQLLRCRGEPGRPINRHAAPKAAGYWGLRRFALAPSLLC